MSMTIILYIGKAAASKLVEAGLKKAMGVEVQGSTVGDWAETLALAIFTGAPMVPEPTFEQKANRRFHELETEIANLKDDLTDLKNEMADFKWKVQTMLYEAREEDLWQTGPSFDKPIKIYDDYRKTLNITKPGEYIFKGGHQLSVRFPNTGLGGRAITVEIEAQLTPEP